MKVYTHTQTLVCVYTFLHFYLFFLTRDVSERKESGHQQKENIVVRDDHDQCPKKIAESHVTLGYWEESWRTEDAGVWTLMKNHDLELVGKIHDDDNILGHFCPIFKQNKNFVLSKE